MRKDPTIIDTENPKKACLTWDQIWRAVKLIRNRMSAEKLAEPTWMFADQRLVCQHQSFQSWSCFSVHVQLCEKDGQLLSIISFSTEENPEDPATWQPIEAQVVARLGVLEKLLIWSQIKKREEYFLLIKLT